MVFGASLVSSELFDLSVIPLLEDTFTEGLALLASYIGRDCNSHLHRRKR